ncbi:MAG: hypothetical protein H7296_03045 [Bacteroidia bacterium]|nr:hypothetical protein [Bacteroidia bacterium]
MYKAVLDKCQFIRQLNEKIYLRSSLLESGNNLVIDKHLNIHDDKSLREIIEKAGFLLMDEGRAIELVEAVNNRTSKAIDSSAMFCLIMGVANHYCGENYDAIQYFSKAFKFKDELTVEWIDHLVYFDTITKYSLGLISDEKHTAAACVSLRGLIHP